MKWVADRTGRFAKRPHYLESELDFECEALVAGFLSARHGSIKYPIDTNDLVVLVEQEAADVDLYADLSAEGPTVEGVTYFEVGSKPVVKISSRFADDPWAINRFRTTLTHEMGHVKFHAPLWLEIEEPLLFDEPTQGDAGGSQPRCRRQTMIEAPAVDWMEWQAGYACGAFLMPVSALKATAADVIRSAGHYGQAAAGSAVGRELIATVMEGFAVSSDAATVRLRRLGYLGSAAAPVGSLFDGGD